MRSIHAAAALLACVHVGACTGPSGAAFQDLDPVIDTVATTLTWTVGGADEVGGVVIGASVPPGAAVNEAGVVLLADPPSGSVIVIGAEGTERPRVGRRGSGPGEMQQPGRVGFANDTIVWVEDRTLRRISYFSIDGVWLFDRPAQRQAVVGSTWAARPSWAIGIKYTLAEPSPSQLTVQQDRAPVVVWDDTNAMNVLHWIDVSLPGRPEATTARGFPVAAPSPIRAEPMYGVAGQDWVFAADRTPPQSPAPAQVVIRRFEPTGRELPAVRIEYDPIAMSDGARREAEAGVAAFLSQVAGNMGEFDRASLAAQTWIPTFYPPLREIFADTSGLWLRRYSEEQPMPAERYTLDGTRTGIVPPVHGERWLDANRNYILTMTRDRFDVALIHLHRVALPQ